MMNENQDPVLEPVPERDLDVRPEPISALPDDTSAELPRASMPGDPACPQLPDRDDPDGPAVLNGETTRQHRSRKGLAIGLGCLLLALLTAGGWWLLNHSLRSSPLASLRQSAEKSVDAYLDYIRELPNLHQCVENARSLSNSDTTHLDLNVHAESEAFAELGSQFTFRLTLDRDMRAKKLRLDGCLESETLTVPIQLYLDADQLQIGSTYALNEGEALSLPVKELGKKWNDSALGKAADVKLPDDFSLSFLLNPGSGEDMEEAFGSDWTSFLDSVSYRPAVSGDGEDRFTGKGESYVLTWDQTLLDKLSERAGWEMSAINNNRMDKLAPCIKVELLKSLSDQLAAPRFRIFEGMLTGIQLRIKGDDGSFRVIRIELLGEDNPWSRSALGICAYDPATDSLGPETVMEYSLTVEDGQLRGKSISDQPGIGSLEMVYNDADGSYATTASGTGDEVSTLMEGMETRMVPTDGGLRLEGSSDLATFSTFSHGDTEGSLQISLELSTKTGTIQPISESPIELLDLSELNLGMLVMRIMQKLNPSSDGAIGGFN